MYMLYTGIFLKENLSCSFYKHAWPTALYNAYMLLLTSYFITYRLPKYAVYDSYHIRTEMNS